MKSLSRGAEPHELRLWKQANRNLPENLKYGRANFPAEEIRCALLRQQYYLCAYTLIRLKKPEDCNDDHKTRESCHIEHILPQTRRDLVDRKLKGEDVKDVIDFTPGEDIDFHNMIACFPPSQSGIHCGYGAKFKDHYDPKDHPLFLSPLAFHVETHFSFLLNGHVQGCTERGVETIRALQLDHAELCHRRHLVITGAIYPRGKHRNPISATEARRLAADVLQPSPDGRLREFCVAISQVALQHAVKLERRANRLIEQNRR